MARMVARHMPSGSKGETGASDLYERHSMRSSTLLRTALAAALCSGGLSVAAASADVTPPDYGNGGFESPAISTSYQTFSAGDTIGAGGWFVDAGGVDVVQSPYPVHGGNQALDLNSCEPGTISQTFSTVAGHAYDVLYWVNTNGGQDWNIRIDIDGAGPVTGDGHYTGDTATSAAHQVVNGWEQWGPSGMIAGGNSMKITLTSLQATGCGGIVLDDIAVTAHNTVPVVDDQSVTTSEDTASSAIPLGGATDADGDAVTYASSTPGHGTLAITGNSATYTPASNYNGPDSFVVTGTDPLGESDTGLVSVTVTAVQDPSTIRNTAPSNGIYTNKKSTVVFHAMVGSTDPSCVAGRSVTFSVPGNASVVGLTDSTGLASGKFSLSEGAYSVTSTVASTAACGGGSDTDPYVFQQPKK
jgi:hypothetical protein